MARKIKIYNRIPREPCPFFGFILLGGNRLIEVKGGGCALNSGRRCLMKASGKNTQASWSECLYRSGSNLISISEIVKICRVFAKEFQSSQNSDWNGIGFHDWMTYVLGPKVLRP